MSTPSEPPPRTPSWKTSQNAPSRRQVAAPRWKREGEASAPITARRSRPLLIAMAAASGLAVAGLFLWLVLWLRPLPQGELALYGAGYQENLALPHNAYGLNGLEVLSDLAQASGAARTSSRSASGYPEGLASAHPAPVVLTSENQLYDDLGPSRARTTVLVLALHGAADDRGPYLLLDRDRPDAPIGRIYLADLIARLKALSPRRFVLVLDPTQLASAPQLGILHNDFAARFQALSREIEAARNLVVMVSSGVDQASWVSDRWRTTVFAHYLAEGLAGGQGEFNGKRIDVDALHRYVRRKVARWVLDNRGAAQTPMLFPDNGRARAFEVAIAPTADASALRRSDLATPPPILAPRREAWEAAWNDHQALQRSAASHAVNAPLLWRRYRDWLVRYDQLVRADDDRAVAVKRTVDRLRDALRAGARVPLDSSTNTLAMPAVEGPAPADPAASQAEFNKLWADPAAVKDMKLVDRPEVRRAFTQWLYRRVEAEPTADNLANALKLLPDLAEPGKPRPAEVHFLAMLAAHAPRSAAGRDRLAKALRVRAHAERSALGLGLAATDSAGPAAPERVAPWVAATIRQADDARRRGEDLAFADDPTSVAALHARLDEAEALYRKADADAARARDALITCDRALADLPFLAEWAAQSPADANPADRVVALLGKAYALAPKLTPGPDGAGLDGVTAEAKDLAEGLDGLRATFAKGIASNDAPYAATASALLTPFVDGPARREPLLKRLVELSPEGRPGAGLSEPSLLAAEGEAEITARAAARRREALALALLGDDWTPPADLPVGNEAEPTAAEVPPAATSTSPPAPSETRPSFDRAEKGLMARSGARVGARWRSLLRSLRRWGQSAEAGADRPDLAMADRLGRRLPASLAGSLADPADADRAALLQDLLVAQARRTLADHWFGPDDRPDAKPYYQLAGLLYLKDARALDPGQKDPAGAVPLRADLARVDRLAVEGPPPLAVTSETRASVEYRLSIPKGSLVPPGFPVVWIAREADALLRTEPAKDVRASREVLAVPAASASGTAPPAARFRGVLELELPRAAEAKPEAFPRPEERKTAVVLDGFYRGQDLHVVTPVTFHPVAEITVARHPLPTRGKVAVSADPALIARYGEGGGALAIVLDCSGSMSYVTAYGPDGRPTRTKYQEATAALRQLLPKVARGTRVSLWVFGEAIGPNDPVSRAEETVRPILAPTAWNPDDPAQLEQLMRQVEPPSLVPHNESAILRAMILARDDLRDAPGYKALLVLTDGKDNRFESDAELNRAKKDVPTALRDAFGSSDIEINVVGYKLKSAEEVEARKQFKVIEEFPRAGHFSSVSDAGKLANTLARALRPSLSCTVETAGNIAVDARTVSRTGDNERWSKPGLVPGGYKLVARAGGRQERDIRLDRGDMLLVRLTNPGGGLGMERGLYSGDPHPRGAIEKDTGWRPSVVRNGRGGKSGEGLELWTTLEKLPSPEERALAMIKPREIWTEVVPAPDAQAADVPLAPTYAQRWSYRVGLPAPTWGVRVPAWPVAAGTPAPARPSVRVWWDPDQEAPLTSEVVRLADFRSTDEIPAREVKVGARTVFIESVGVETRRVESAPGVSRDESCLVVRLRHEEGQPFWVRPEGLRTEGAEHRFYAKANKYTGIFWPVTADQVDVALKGLGLVSLADFKARAERRGYHAELPALGTPNAADTGPHLLPFDEPEAAPIPSTGGAVAADR